MPTSIERFRQVLEDEASDFGVVLKADHIERLSAYYKILLKWNGTLHLVAPCSAEEFATRHVLESLLLVAHLPPNARLVDVGSGAGLPAIPCLIVRKDLTATLIESSKRKAVFLREALIRTGATEQAEVISKRFEEIGPRAADFVTARALDRFPHVLEKLIEWAPARGTFLFFAGKALRDQIETLLAKVQVEQIPKSSGRFLVIARRE
jgi:16S rRNA (guanine527-N7)-methyltransferase